MKNQGKCGSSAAFATAAIMEVCMAKLTGEPAGGQDDISEQQLLDCGRHYQGADGCLGAPAHAYAGWVVKTAAQLVSEDDYPYMDGSREPKCADQSLPPLNGGAAKVTRSYYTYNGTEGLMRKLVHAHGAVLATLTAKARRKI